MKKTRLKQRKRFAVLKGLVIFSAVFIFVYIGVQPYVADFNSTLATVFSIICDVMVVAVLIAVFLYYSGYGKCDSFLNQVENEINDSGYYITARKENTTESYADAVTEDLKSNGYSVTTDLEINEFDFNVKAINGKSYFYTAAVDNVDKNDIVAYIDAVINDLTVQNLKSKGNAVICFITDRAEESAVALSKMITPIGKKEQLKIALAICETDTGRVYFLGNVQTKFQKMIANFAMNCDVPINNKYIGGEKLPFQYDLEEKMKSFTVKDYKNGNFYIH